MNKIYSILPHFFQNLLISLFNYLAYKKRYGGKYKTYLKQFENNRLLSFQELKTIQNNRFEAFLKQTFSTSPFYKSIYEDFPDYYKLENIKKLPILDKEIFRTQIENINTIPKSKGIVSKTGGTTGKSLEVLFTPENMQERFAMLDDFRGRFGYQLGKKTAWFSGKNLLNSRDISKNRFSKTDYLHHVKYYSTFHIKEDYMKYYISDLIQFQPEYIVGFPSSLLEIAKFGIKNNIDFPSNVIKAVFPTAETITPEIRENIEFFFKTKVYNQYASSEGAPFIMECPNNKLHLELQSGVFEVLDENNSEANLGKLVITSFTTEGTPLIRYDIGDSIELSNESCNCGNNNPVVNEILGRIDDYVYSPANGKINLGNVSNTLKDTYGIIRFQVLQDNLDEIIILLQKDGEVYNSKTEDVFLKNWRERIGYEMKIQIEYVLDIPVEPSGKFRMVKNNIKHLIN